MEAEGYEKIVWIYDLKNLKMNFERLKKVYQERNYQNIDVKPGQYLEIRERIWEWKNERIWRFRGLVLRVKKKNQPEGSFTVRGKVAWVTVEKIYPLSYPKFESIKILDEYRIRRAKLYYIRQKVGKQAKLRSRKDANKWVELVSW